MKLSGVTNGEFAHHAKLTKGAQHRREYQALCSEPIDEKIGRWLLAKRKPP